MLTKITEGWWKYTTPHNCIAGYGRRPLEAYRAWWQALRRMAWDGRLTGDDD